MIRPQMMLWMFLPLMVCLSGCLAAIPILGVEMACAITSASRANAPVIDDKFGDEPLFQAEAKTKCAEDGAGPDTDCVNYMMQ
jgi:hypothetical protein